MYRMRLCPFHPVHAQQFYPCTECCKGENDSELRPPATANAVYGETTNQSKATDQPATTPHPLITPHAPPDAVATHP